MKNALLLFSLALAVLGASGCRMRDIRTVTLTVPDLKNEACLTVIQKSAFAKLPKHAIVKDVTPGDANFATGELTVTYDSMIVGIKNIENAIAQSGFATGPFKADPQAVKKLPVECGVTAN